MSNQFQVIRTTGDRGLDTELRRMIGRISALETANTTTSAPSTTTVIEQAGVQSLGSQGELVSIGGTGTAPIVLVAVPIVAADPSSPSVGDIWFNTADNALCLYTGAAIRRVGMS